MQDSQKQINSQIVHPPLGISPPICTEQSRTFGKVDLLRRERIHELFLLAGISGVTVEGGASELGICLLQNLDRKLAAVDPIMIVRDDLRAPKPVAVHQGSQRHPNVRLLSGSEYTGGVRGVGVLGFVLDPDCVGGDSLVPEPLQGLQKVHCIWGAFRLGMKMTRVIHN